MERISRDRMLMRMAEVAAQRSTCARAQVGAIIAREGRVLSTGYNGAPAGLPHCDHTCNCSPMALMADDKPMRDIHESTCPANMACEISVHAESNSLAFAARFGVGVNRAELFCTHLPCPRCASLIINAGIIRVVYGTDYRLNDGSDLLRSAGVLIERLPLDMM